MNVLDQKKEMCLSFDTPPCTGRMLHQSYSLAVRLDTAIYVKRFPLLFR